MIEPIFREKGYDTTEVSWGNTTNPEPWFDYILDSTFSQLAPGEQLRPASSFPENANTPSLSSLTRDPEVPEPSECQRLAVKVWTRMCDEMRGNLERLTDLRRSSIVSKGPLLHRSLQDAKTHAHSLVEIRHETSTDPSKPDAALPSQPDLSEWSDPSHFWKWLHEL